MYSFTKMYSNVLKTDSSATFDNFYELVASDLTNSASMSAHLFMFLFFGGCEIYQTRLAIANAKGAAQK
jgi:hypothetical protein